MTDTVSDPCCRGVSQGKLPQDAVQCLDVALKQPAMFNPKVVTLPRAFFLEDPASAIGLGGPSEVSTVVRYSLKGPCCATHSRSLTWHGGRHEAMALVGFDTWLGSCCVLAAGSRM